VYATVHGADGHLAPGLGQKDFQVFDNGRPVEITLFSNDVVPITVALMLDMSGSMSSEFMRVRQSAAEFVGQLLPDDRVRIGSFGDEVAVSPLLTGDKNTLLRVLREEVWPGGGTPLWTALDRGMRSLAEEPGRRVVLTVTDGVNGCAGKQPCASLGAVRQEAEAQGFLIYAIGMEKAPLAREIVDLTEDTGGGHFNVASNVDLSATFAQVADELHHQYVLGFTPALLDGKAHKLEVRVSCAGCTARARARYVAAKDP
jgi:VWFA-related protein